MKFKIICIMLLLCLGSASHASAQGDESQTISTEAQDWLSPSYPWFGFNFTMWTDPSALPFDVTQARSFFSSYYYTSGSPVVGIISTPVRFDIRTRTPEAVYLGTGQQLTYSQYASTVGQYLSNQLFIQGQDAWTQYLVVPAGTWLQLVAYSPSGGDAEFYDVLQKAPGDVATEYRQYQLTPGYNTMSYMADQTGRHMILFVSNGLPSNALVVDVLEDMPTSPSSTAVTPSQGTTQGSVTPPSYQPPTYQQQAPRPPSYQTPIYQTPVSQPSTSVPAPTQGDTPVTIRYPGANPFEVYLDGAYIGSGQGSFSFNVAGDMYHTIRVFDGFWPYERTVFVQRGIQKIIFVEAV